MGKFGLLASETDAEGFQQGFHLPKGLFMPALEEDVLKINDNKENLVINLAEDAGIILFDLLEALDKLFKLPVMNEINEKFNVFVVWSTSLDDCKKTFAELRKIVNIENIKLLNLLDRSINTGSGPDWSPAISDNANGEAVAAYVTDEAGVNKQNIRTLFQTSLPNNELRFNFSPSTRAWTNLLGELAVNRVINKLAEALHDENTLEPGREPQLHKLDDGINTEKNMFNGLLIPIKAFLKALDYTFESSSKSLE
jgi:hypothetical protein